MLSNKIWRTAKAIQRIKKYEGVLIVIAAGMVLLGFIVRDNKLEEAKKAEQTQSNANVLLSEAAQFTLVGTGAGGYDAVIQAEIIYSRPLSELEKNFKLMPIRREQIAGQMHILASADDRINHLHNADEERRRIKAIREKGHDLVRLYNQFLIAANGDLAELSKSEKERNEVVAAMGNFETGWTSFRQDSTVLVRDIARKAETEEHQAEKSVVFWTWINNVVFGFAWVIALVSKFCGIKASDEEQG